MGNQEAIGWNYVKSACYEQEYQDNHGNVSREKFEGTNEGKDDLAAPK